MRACAARFINLMGLALSKVLIMLKSDDELGHNWQKNRYHKQMAKFNIVRFISNDKFSYHHVIVDWSQIHFFMTRHFIILFIGLYP